MMPALKALSLILMGLALQATAAGTELAIHFTAVQRVLAQQIFTQDGRKYLRGAPTARCYYAYLENPQISGEGGVLNVKARFSGRTALNLFGKCVGLGDSFDLAITAIPFCQDGVLRLRDVRVIGQGRDGFYIRRVSAALAESLRTQFSYRVVDEARKILEQEARPGYKQELVKFQVPSVRVTADAVVLSLEFTLAVK
jgi:hypothetical protein